MDRTVETAAALDRRVDDEAEPSRGRLLVIVPLLWIAGVGLRITLLAVPPVIPLLHEDLRLTQTEVGVLSSLPTLMLAWAAVPGSLLIARFGAVRTLVVGLALTAAASALRGAAPDVATLFAATLLMGIGVAVMQPSMPPIVRAWLPSRIGFGTAVYTNGMFIGQVMVVWLTIPYVLPALGGSWRLAFVAWSLPVAAAALLVLLLAPRPAPRVGGPGGARRWWPSWRSALLWRLGLFTGSVNTIYFATNAFLPDYLSQAGRPELIGGALTALNLGGLPASLLMLAFAGRLARRRWPYLAAGLAMVSAVVGMACQPGPWVVFWAAVLGFSNTVTFVLALALPALLCSPEDVPRVSAGMFTISYHWAVAVTILGGVAWDATGTSHVALALLGLSALAAAMIAPTAGLARAPANGLEPGRGVR